MKNYVARAMQVDCLLPEQLQEIQSIERQRGYCLSNWMIQLFLGIGTIKDSLHIPDAPEPMALHAARIENELKRHGYLKGDDEAVGVEWTHAFDWMVKKNPKKIDFKYAGPRAAGNVASRIKKAKADLFDDD